MLEKFKSNAKTSDAKKNVEMGIYQGSNPYDTQPSTADQDIKRASRT